VVCIVFEGTPDNWTTMNINQQCFLVNLDKTRNEYQNVYDRFVDKGGPKTVFQVNNHTIDISNTEPDPFHVIAEPLYISRLILSI
jgi:hypothetical protein